MGFGMEMEAFVSALFASDYSSSSFFHSSSDGSEIFINAPSFEAIWYLNKYAREVYGKENLKPQKKFLAYLLLKQL